jgi:hypothetical protein
VLECFDCIVMFVGPVVDARELSESCPLMGVCSLLDIEPLVWCVIVCVVSVRDKYNSIWPKSNNKTHFTP